MKLTYISKSKKKKKKHQDFNVASYIIFCIHVNGISVSRYPRDEANSLL